MVVQGAEVTTGVTTDAPNTTFEVTADGDHTCPGCGKEWRIAYAVVWVEAGAEAG